MKVTLKATGKEIDVDGGTAHQMMNEGTAIRRSFPGTKKPAGPPAKKGNARAKKGKK